MTPIVKTAIGLAVVTVIVFGALLLAPASSPTTSKAAGPTLNIAFNQELAQRGATVFSSRGCGACHAVSSAGIAGGTAGPDLSRVLIGEAPAGTRPEAHPLPKWYTEQGLANPASDPDRAARLLREFLEHPPAYSPMMLGQIQQLKSRGEEQWEKDVQALVELFKKAAVGK